ncbi:hypothetical protein CDG77_07305 [Nostoc sp. 'Peltigera membranacea cyanobiont' 213]|nr:hypothetical protein CDG77_07305 [Nostoc sp. 'Peltigera membranacea cyanobiont' 213]
MANRFHGFAFLAWVQTPLRFCSQVWFNFGTSYMKVGIGNWVIINSSSSPASPASPASPTPLLPIPQDILKTVVANYALDKLKIEIAGNSHPA